MPGEEIITRVPGRICGFAKVFRASDIAQCLASEAISLPVPGIRLYLINMRRNSEAGLDADFQRGRRELARHRPDLAVRSLRTAVDACPATRPGMLSRNLYWLAIALLRLDRSEIALRSLASAQKLRPRSLARLAYVNRVNDYGMGDDRVRSSTIFTHFIRSRHASTSAESRGPVRINAEKDIVTRLIGDAWRTFSCSDALVGLSSSEKLALFKSRKIEFPSFGLHPAMRGRILEADFRAVSKLDGEKRCSCGSGLPYIRCCGRTSTPRERFCE